MKRHSVGIGRNLNALPPRRGCPELSISPALPITLPLRVKLRLSEQIRSIFFAPRGVDTAESS